MDTRTPPPGWRFKEDGHNTIETEDGSCYVGINERGNVFVHAPKSAKAISNSGGPCPKCGSADGPYDGFGLAGGGFGPYVGCHTCKAFAKSAIPDGRT